MAAPPSIRASAPDIGREPVQPDPLGERGAPGLIVDCMRRARYAISLGTRRLTGRTPGPQPPRPSGRWTATAASGAPELSDDGYLPQCAEPALMEERRLEQQVEPVAEREDAGRPNDRPG